VSDHVLDPGFTRQPLYVTHDVTSALTQGNNAIGVILGNGFLNVHANDVWNFDTAPWRMPPRALVQLQITYDDGTTQTIVSDENWKVANGPIVFDGIRNGETYDARLEKPGWSTASFVEDASWRNALVVRSPGGVLSAQMFPPQKVVRSLQAATVTSPLAGVYVFDFKQNTAGGAAPVSGPAAPDHDGTAETAANGTVIKATSASTFRWARSGRHVHLEGARNGDLGACSLAGLSASRGPRIPGTPAAPRRRSSTLAFDTVGSFLNDLPTRSQATGGRTRQLPDIPTDSAARERVTADAHLAARLDVQRQRRRRIRNDPRLPRRNEAETQLPGIIPTSGWGLASVRRDSALAIIPPLPIHGRRQIPQAPTIFSRVTWIGSARATT
jgi:alpha-L-rhamnosidase